MSDKGIGTGACDEHGEFILDAPDSPCPSCEDTETFITTDGYSFRKVGNVWTDGDMEFHVRPDLLGVTTLEPTHFNCCHAPKDLGHMFGCGERNDEQSI